MSESVYYKAAGRSLEAILKYVADAVVARKAWAEFAAQYGATEYMTSSGFYEQSFSGLVKKPSHPLWRQAKDVWVPCRTSGAGRKIADAMNMLPKLKLGTDAGHIYFGEGRAFFPGFEKLGQDYIIKCHEKAELPLDAIPLKRSEYWSLKEATPCPAQ